MPDFELSFWPSSRKPIDTLNRIMSGIEKDNSAGHEKLQGEHLFSY